MVLKRNLTKKATYFILAIVLVVALIAAIYLTFIYLPECQNFACFQSYMTKCSRATFVNEEPEASWGYEIKMAQGKECVINVKLLMAKQGELGVEKFVGHEMTCYYPLGSSAYPEKDLSKCHGLLKEEIQEIIINKLHSHILENLGKFDESLSKL